MKKSLLLLVLLCGCAGSKPATADTKSSVNIILSSDSKTRAIINDNLPLRCAFIKEWDVSTIRDDKRKEGCWCMYPPFVGPSSGANYLGAGFLKKKYKNVVTVFSDRGERYLSEHFY